MNYLEVCFKRGRLMLSHMYLEKDLGNQYM
jgi:hypothetical protein